MRRALLTALLLCLLHTPTEAFTTPPQYAVLSDVIIGQTVVAGCPTIAQIEQIEAEGRRLGADFTKIEIVGNASACPNFSASWIERKTIPNGFTYIFRYAVTLGIHYRLGK